MERLHIDGKCTVKHYGGIIQAKRIFVLSLREKYFLMNRYLDYDTNQNENWNFLKQSNKVENALLDRGVCYILSSVWWLYLWPVPILKSRKRKFILDTWWGFLNENFISFHFISFHFISFQNFHLRSKIQTMKKTIHLTLSGI